MGHYRRPMQCLSPFYKFSLKAPTVNVVRKVLLKLKERKTAGLDNIPSELLKMAGNIVAPSLTQIFTKSSSSAWYLSDSVEIAMGDPCFQVKEKRDDPNNCQLITIIPTAARMFEKIIYD